MDIYFLIRRVLRILTLLQFADGANIWGAMDTVLAQGSRADVSDEDRSAFLRQLLATVELRQKLTTHPGEDSLKEAPSFLCPAPGSGVGNWTNPMEEHHYKRHSYWANEGDHCSNALGLWTNGCGVMCPLRVAVMGSAVALAPGQLVLDIGSACGHAALWYHEWFGARTFGVDFVQEAVAFANGRVATAAPTQFCWFDLASHAHWLPTGVADLAAAVSVLHYLRTDVGRYETGDDPAGGSRDARRTPCRALHGTKGTQCHAAREMFRAVKVGGTVWISHNGSYKGKWDPKLVWGPDYWRCCFWREEQRGAAEIHEVDELDLFMHSSKWDPTYSLIVRRLAA